MDNSKLHACSLVQSVVTHYWRCKITLAMHRQACLGMHCRIHALQRHHRFKANLLNTVNLCEKVIQWNPFQNNAMMLNESNRYESYATSSKRDNLDKTFSSVPVSKHLENDSISLTLRSLYHSGDSNNSHRYLVFTTFFIFVR